MIAVHPQGTSVSDKGFSECSHCTGITAAAGYSGGRNTTCS